MAVYSDQEKLETLERVLDQSRYHEATRELFSREDRLILKAICADIKARDPAIGNRVLDAISFQVNSAALAKARLGYLDVGHHQALAEALLAHWPAVRVALEKSNQRGKSE